MVGAFSFSINTVDEFCTQKTELFYTKPMLPFVYEVYYLRWHYTYGVADLLSLWGRFFAFVAHFFSIGLLTRTLFYPWRLLRENTKGGFDPGELFERVLTNIIMRIIGFFLRLLLILLGIAMHIVVAVVGLVVFFVWIFLPIIVLGLFYEGIRLLIV